MNLSSQSIIEAVFNNSSQFTLQSPRVDTQRYLELTTLNEQTPSFNREYIRDPASPNIQIHQNYSFQPEQQIQIPPQSISKQGIDSQNPPLNTHSQQESNQQSTQLSTSPNRQVQQQQGNQQHNIYNQHYQMSNNNGNQAHLVQQQTATLLNQKIKQLSQKFQIQ